MEKKTQGGVRENAGRKEIDPEEKKVSVTFQIKKKHVESARLKLQPIIDRINRR